MQKIKVLQNLLFSGITSDSNSDVNTNSVEPLSSSNNYYSYLTQTGGNVVNNNNVRDFLDKPENSNIAKAFVDYLQSNTNFTEFKEIFYDNKKLADTFNGFYKTNFINSDYENNSIQESLKNTSNISTKNYNFNLSNQRIGGNIDALSSTPISGDSYYVNIRIDKDSNIYPTGNYSEYFRDCIKGSYEYIKLSYINDLSYESISANIPWLLNQRNVSNMSNFGYAPIPGVDFSRIGISNTLILFLQKATRNYLFTFENYTDFCVYVNFSAQQLLSNIPGRFISQTAIVFPGLPGRPGAQRLASGFTQNPDKNGNPVIIPSSEFYIAFEPVGLTQFNLNSSTAVTIPIKINLSAPSITGDTFYVKFESISESILNYDFSFNNWLTNNSNHMQIDFLPNETTKTIYIDVFDKFVPEDSIVFSIVDSNTLIKGYLIIRCEEFFEIKKYNNNSYILREIEQKNKLFLNCFVDYNFNDNDLEFYRNGRNNRNNTSII